MFILGKPGPGIDAVGATHPSPSIPPERAAPRAPLMMVKLPPHVIHLFNFCPRIRCSSIDSSSLALCRVGFGVSKSQTALLVDNSCLRHMAESKSAIPSSPANGLSCFGKVCQPTTLTELSIQFYHTNPHSQPCMASKDMED